jgi:hypothetical protein
MGSTTPATKSAAVVRGRSVMRTGHLTSRRFDGRDALLKKLGKHSTGGGCLLKRQTQQCSGVFACKPRGRRWIAVWRCAIRPFSA